MGLVADALLEIQRCMWIVHIRPKELWPLITVRIAIRNSAPIPRENQPKSGEISGNAAQQKTSIFAPVAETMVKHFGEDYCGECRTYYGFHQGYCSVVRGNKKSLTTNDEGEV